MPSPLSEHHAPIEEDLSGLTLRRGLRLDARIAKGSFGAVYRARQLDVGRDVAVKLLHAEFDPDDTAGRLFRDEIRAIGRIDHRNIVRIYDADLTVDGRLYFVMELLAGITLQQIADTGAVPLPRALALVTQLLDGLTAVHAAGHIHADVKPSNAIVVTSAGDERVVLFDFGLSRLLHPDKPVEAMGGTRAYMAPEQLTAWEVDARSDVFSAALVLVRLVTGWQRRDDMAQLPSLDGIDDAAVRRALERATARDPQVRPNAADFARSLRGGLPEEQPTPSPRPPFLHLSPMTAHDRGRLHGRESDVVRLARQLDPARPVILVAPSGTGKTSLLCAGLASYLDADGVENLYHACRSDTTAAQLAQSIWPKASKIPEACAARRCARDRRLVVIVDQIETILVEAARGEALLEELLEPNGQLCDVAIVLAVREDFASRMIAANPILARGVPQVRLGPLDREGARQALLAPLAEHEVRVSDDLLEIVLDDLVRAGAELGATLGWRTGPAVYPPHLQLIGEALWNVRGPRQNTLTMSDYQSLGGLETVIAEQLDRKLATLPPGDQAVARDVFVSLVASGQVRAVRSEDELLASVGSRHGPDVVRRVLDMLEHERLVLRRGTVDERTNWELVHDSLVPRIEAWLSIHDLDRRRAAEMIRFHLLQSQASTPVLLSGRQLRLVDSFPDLVDELDGEWGRRSGVAWMPSALVARSRGALRRRYATRTISIVTVLALTSLLTFRWWDERDRRAQEARLRAAEESLRDRDLGRFDLTLSAFEWTGMAEELVPVDVDAASLPELNWVLYEPNFDSPDDLGEPVSADRLKRGDVTFTNGARVERGIEARGGDAFLAITGRGRADQTCPPSIVSLRRLPGYARRGTPSHIHLRIPTCGATLANMIRIPEGPFVSGGVGEPPSRYSVDLFEAERIKDLPEYWMDRTEITNEAFEVYSATTGNTVGEYPSDLAFAAGRAFPRTDIDLSDARAYCRFLGKDLPTSDQWSKALRGGLTLADGEVNPMPRRNLPWGAPRTFAKVALYANGLRGPSSVGSHVDDISPYGVVDLAGNVMEWTRTPVADAVASAAKWKVNHVTRGGDWYDTKLADLVDYMASENPRPPRKRTYYLGARCALELRGTQ